MLRYSRPQFTMIRYVMLVLLLGGFSSIAIARDVQMHSANGDGGGGGGESCPDETSTATATKHVAPKASRSKVKIPTTLRSGSADDGVGHTPRWHSFLPGMFR